MKKFILSLIVVVASLSSSLAATATVSNASAGAAAVVSVPCVLQKLTLYSTNATPTIVQIFDGSVTVTNSAYTNFTAATSTVVESYVGANGLTNAYTNTVTAITANEVAGATVARSPLLSLIVPANNVPVEIENINIPLTYKLVLSNNLTGVSGIVTYRTP